MLDDSDSLESTGDVQAAVRDPRVRFFRSDAPKGVAGGRNFLMERATGDAVFVIDDDAYFDDRGALARVAKTFLDRSDVSIIATRIVDHPPGGGERLLVPFTRRALRRDPSLAQRAQFVSYYVGGGHAIHRRVLERVGGYPDDLMYGEEELDLAYRAIDDGLRIWYDPAVVVQHHPQPAHLHTAGRTRRPEAYFHARNRILIAYKHLPARYAAPWLATWLGVLLVRSARRGHTRDYAAGVAAGVRALRNARRKPVARGAVEYLRRNHGRLWY